MSLKCPKIYLFGLIIFLKFYRKKYIITFEHAKKVDYNKIGTFQLG